MKRVPEEAVDVFEPLGDEVVGDGLGVVGEAQILQCVEEKRRTVIERSDGHLQTHGPQLTGLHLTCQTLQSGRYKQRHHLQEWTPSSLTLESLTYESTVRKMKTSETEQLKV